MVKFKKPKVLSPLWLLLGCLSIAIAGLFSLILVVARTPQLNQLPFFNKLFHEALVVHVDLSVLVWFLAIACLLWSLLSMQSRQIIPYVEESAIICALLALLFITFSPLDPKGVAMMSNYIPVIHSPIFFMGLLFLFCSVALMLLRLFAYSSHFGLFNKMQQYGIYTSGIVTLVALCCFIWAYMAMPPGIDGAQYYELLFWGGGHMLQFTHTQLVMVCWWLLIASVHPGFMLRGHWAKLLFSIVYIAIFAAPLGYLLYDVASMEHRQFFTHLMLGLNGIAPAIFILLLIKPLWQARDIRHSEERAMWSALLMSVLLFAYGGLLGLMIQGQNVVIPAHYHGSIVGVTLAFMGIAYLYFPVFGFREVSGWRLAYWQPIVYGAGQILHITGLAWSGGYGVLRKTPGTEELEFSAQLALGLMGGGGLIAIIGGLMFVVVAARAIFTKSAF